MPEYNVYPSVDENNNFPAPVRKAMAKSTEVSETMAEEIDKRNLLPADDSRLPENGLIDAFEITDMDGEVSFSANPDGSVNLGSVRVEESDAFEIVDLDEKIAFSANPDGSVNIGSTKVEDSGGFEIVDLDNKVAMEILPNGKVYIADPVFGATSTEVRRVVLNIMAGQSNGEGRGRPHGGSLDIPDPRIRMWNWSTKKLDIATVPLSSQQQRVGLSPITVISREVLKNEPIGTEVVILNSAVGGTTLTIDTTASGVWNIGYSGSYPQLYKIMLAEIELVTKSIKDMYGMDPEIRFFWHQGEGENGDGTAYANAFDALVKDLRSKLDLPNMPVVLGGIVPEIIISTGKSSLRGVHLSSASRLYHTAYTDGPVNGGGSANTGDIVHYHRDGVVRLGKFMYDAFFRALVNTQTSVPIPPYSVSATFIKGTLSVEWTPAFCRVTKYVTEYKIDTGSWITAPDGLYPGDNHSVINNLTGSVAQVRITTVNENGSAAPSYPITALGV